MLRVKLRLPWIFRYTVVQGTKTSNIPSTLMTGVDLALLKVFLQITMQPCWHDSKVGGGRRTGLSSASGSSMARAGVKR
jgi:hypothetical protein